MDNPEQDGPWPPGHGVNNQIVTREMAARPRKRLHEKMKDRIGCGSAARLKRSRFIDWIQGRGLEPSEWRRLGTIACNPQWLVERKGSHRMPRLSLASQDIVPVASRCGSLREPVVAVLVILGGLFLLAGCGTLPEPYHREAERYMESGDHKLSLGDHEGALADFDQVVRGYDETFRLGIDPLGVETRLLAEGYLKQGIVKFSLGDYEEAIAALDASLPLLYDMSFLMFGKQRVQTFRALAHYNRGGARMALGDYEGALEDASSAKQHQPHMQGADVLWLFANLHLGYHGTALSALDDLVGEAVARGQSARLGPTYAARSLVRILSGDAPGALSDVEKATGPGEDHATIILMRCTVRFLVRDYTEAVAECDAAHDLAAGVNRRHVMYQARRIGAGAKALSGDLDGAAADYRQTSSPTEAERLVRQGTMSYVHMPLEPGRHEQSFLAALGYIFRGCERWSKGDREQAEADFRRARDLAASARNATLERLAEDGLVRLSSQQSG